MCGYCHCEIPETGMCWVALQEAHLHHCLLSLCFHCLLPPTPPPPKYAACCQNTHSLLPVLFLVLVKYSESFGTILNLRMGMNYAKIYIAYYQVQNVGYLCWLFWGSACTPPLVRGREPFSSALPDCRKQGQFLVPSLDAKSKYYYWLFLVSSLIARNKCSVCHCEYNHSSLFTAEKLLAFSLIIEINVLKNEKQSWQDIKFEWRRHVFLVSPL